jgi:hypothetical protein
LYHDEERIVNLILQVLWAQLTAQIERTPFEKMRYRSSIPAESFPTIFPTNSIQFTEAAAELESGVLSAAYMTLAGASVTAGLASATDITSSLHELPIT